MTERSIRRALNKAGFALSKSRSRLSIDNFGGYRIVSIYDNFIVAGEKFDLSLEDVEAWLKEE